MNTTRALLMSVVVLFCSSVRADLFAGKDVAFRNGLHNDGGKTRASSHRLELLFPLLLRISSRLATLVPTAITAVIGIFLFVAFSKKAFIISLLALFLTYLDKYKREEDVLHIHKINLYNDHEILAHNEEHLHYGWPDERKGYAHVGRYPVAYRYWPYPYKYPGIRYNQWGPPASLEGLRRRNSNYTADFQQFLSQAIDSSGPSIRYY